MDVPKRVPKKKCKEYEGTPEAVPVYAAPAPVAYGYGVAPRAAGYGYGK